MKAENETLNVSRQVAQQINDSIARDLNSLKSLSKMLLSSKDINHTLTEQLKILNQFDHIFVVDKNAKIINIGPHEPNKIGISLQNEDYVQFVLKERKSYISSLQKVFHNEDSIVLAIPIFSDEKNDSGNFFGIICATMHIDNLFKPVNNINNQNSNLGLVVDTHGNLLSYPKNKFGNASQLVNLDEKNSSISKIQEVITQKDYGVARYSIKGLQYIAGFQKMNFQNWSVLVSIPIDDVLVDVYRLKKNIIMLTTSFLIFTIILTMLITYRAQNLHFSVEKNLVELKTIQTKLINSSKMSALGEMAGGIAHEINTPLGVITLRASQAKRLLAKGTDELESVKIYIETIEHVAQQIAKIVQGLRAFSRSEGEERAIITSVRSIFDNTLILCTERLKQRGITLIDELKDKNLGLECRSVQISQVLLNLINNACDAITPLEEKWIEIAAKEVNDKIEISVRNSGPKIPENIREKIMEPFFTTKEIGQGTGLGLSLSKGIVEAHFGRLYLDPICDQTRFVAEIPKKANRTPLTKTLPSQV
jgi:signal transduction histidine kinase